MKYIYRIELKNYEGEYSIELYHHKSNALKRFQELKNEAQQKDEFDYYYNTLVEKGELSFFDPNYNENSTFITLTKCDYERLFEDRA